tara:strand:+ start:9802 stop:9999 length:198 start_codon:yes stop_codon:yes gene_type:complete
MSELSRITEKLFKDNLNFPLILRQIDSKVNLEEYPWDECIADQTKRYGAEAAPKICGYIKEKYGN